VITTTQYRDKGMGEKYGPDEYKRSVEDALEMLVKYELGWGADVTDFCMDPPRIETRTRVMGCIDTTIFTGSVDEMKPLLSILPIWAQAKSTVAMEAIAEKVIEVTNGNALLITHGVADLLYGKMIVKRMMLIALGIVNDDTLKQFELLTEKDFKSALSFLVEGLSSDEILSLLK